MANPLVVIDDLDIGGAIFRPNETQAPLFIDPDTMLTFSIILQRFQVVARRYSQVVQTNRPFQLCKLAQSRAFNVDPALHAPALKKRSGFFALERLNSHERQ